MALKSSNEKKKFHLFIEANCESIPRLGPLLPSQSWLLGAFPFFIIGVYHLPFQSRQDGLSLSASVAEAILQKGIFPSATHNLSLARSDRTPRYGNDLCFSEEGREETN